MLIKHLIFDLDDTLYPSGKMTKAITQNMIKYVAKFFNVTYEEAVARRKKNLPMFGSTLEWLMNSGMTDAEDYLFAVHPENETENLLPDPEMRQFLLSLEIPMTVLTNAPMEHAERVLNFLNIKDLFSSVTDIRDCGLKGKPYPIAFETALRRSGGTVGDTLFIDDQIKYILGYKRLGGICAHIGSPSYEASSVPSFLSDAAAAAGKIFHIDSVYDLPTVLKQIADL
ncbi:HAD-IA family hydrolase [Treponema parvum]|uniref:HAD-IA family hydrolase n=1 Tax=Treponema parvum TaxID=138851 RepID=UPI001AEC6C8B|nr:HAD-IA family hydrolase [Treponema parvum]QTQ17056.1 HAD-IA family hydrolase [Treponema parvum]